MKKFTVISLSTLAAALTFVGCNSSSNSYEYELSANVAVSSFKLAQDDSVLANLDTVFFSIDLANGKIFNADSLPYGTKINKLVPRITMNSGATSMKLTVHRANGTDTVYDYIENPGDSIDFSNGPVRLDVSSASATASKTYEISVNVHTVVSDSLAWGETAWTELPSALSTPTAQRTARTDDGLYCLTTDAKGRFSMAFTATPATGDWEKKAVTLPAGADITSLAGSSNALYILVDDGANEPNKMLYTSADGGSTWTATGERYYYIYGGFGSDVLVSRYANEWRAAAYPSNPEGSVMAADMPVAGTSLPVAFSTPMSLTQQAIVVGGVKADGSLSAQAWGYDGTSWMLISQDPFPTALTDMMLVPFYVVHINSYFVTTKYSVLLAFGGNDGSENSRDVYVSYYMGVDWHKASDYLQLPDYIPALNGAQAFVFDTTMGDGLAEADTEWHPVDVVHRFPSGVSIVPQQPDLTTMATKPITTWECPFIYIFGGVTDDNQLNPEIWRGTINRLRFKPIQ